MVHQYLVEKKNTQHPMICDFCFTNGGKKSRHGIFEMRRKPGIRSICSKYKSFSSQNAPQTLTKAWAKQLIANETRCIWLTLY